MTSIRQRHFPTVLLFFIVSMTPLRLWSTHSPEASPVVVRLPSCQLLGPRTLTAAKPVALTLAPQSNKTPCPR